MPQPLVAKGIVMAMMDGWVGGVGLGVSVNMSVNT